MGKSQKTYMSIKSKLVAAVAMLLVASFMVVSSTYAWFTLSTAPEVTGIKTTIGSNGSLEIALAYGTSETPFDASKVTSGVGDTNKDTTWGNIVNIGNPDYGMSTLEAGILPSRLNIESYSADTGAIIGLNPLSTPVYSADGRIEKLEKTTVFGIYDKDSASFNTDDESSGVRVIGTASGMTQQQLDYRNAKYAVDTDLATAKALAAQSLTANGPDLASTFASYATGAATTYDVTAIGSVLTTLASAANSIESALKNYYVATAASLAGELGETEYGVVIAAVREASLDTLAGGTFTVEGITLPAAAGEVKQAYDQLGAIRTQLTNATTKYNEITDKEAATGNEMIAALLPIMDVDKVTINGLTKTEVKAEDGMSKLLDAYMAMGNQIYVDLPLDSGVYADIAELTGDYNASIKIKEITVGSMGTLRDIPATMRTHVGAENVINFKQRIPAAPESAANANPKITDFYGYGLDLVFRTNASGSNLMLQSTPAQRIYSDSTLAETLGGGSTMTFNFPNALDTDQQKNLLNSIRIVFTQEEVIGDTTQSKIVAVAGLDTSAIQTTGDGSVATIKLLNYTIVEATEGTETVYKIQLPEDPADRFKANDGESTSWVNKLMPLSANTPTVLSAIVYIDGDHITNADVANAAVSLTGTLNLQFSSDATLVPMEYTPLHQKDTNTSTTSATETSTEATSSEAAGG